MEKTLFHDLLKKAGLSKKEFASMVGTSAGAVSNWGTSGRDIPYWVEPFLNLYIENKECRNLKEILKEALGNHL